MITVEWGDFTLPRESDIAGIDVYRHICFFVVVCSRLWGFIKLQVSYHTVDFMVNYITDFTTLMGA